MKDREVENISQFVHDIRNPLNSITLHAELGKMLIEEIKKAFMVILDQCNSCNQQLKNMRERLTESKDGNHC